MLQKTAKIWDNLRGNVMNGIDISYRLNQAIETVYYLPIAHHDHSNGADARRLLIGRFEVDGNEVPDHFFVYFALTISYELRVSSCSRSSGTVFGLMPIQYLGDSL